MDANFNRSREALRVMEDYARFALDDAALTGALKSARHDLAAAIGTISFLGSKLHTPPERPQIEGPDDARRDSREPDPKHPAVSEGSEGIDLLSHRDTPGDVGTIITTPTESQRGTPDDVLTAACKRLTESLRSLEEYGKTVDSVFAASMEKLRYRAYDLERRLFFTLRARRQFGSVQLYVLITESLCVNGWWETARAVLDAGADCLQLREKSLPDRELLARATRLARLCRDMNRLFILNDRPDIAVAANAHGVHLGQDDLPVVAARRLVSARFIVGLSTHTSEQVDSAIMAVPDYIAVGPMFDSPTKPQPHMAGLSLLKDARRRTSLPLVAIGGIDVDKINFVLAAAPVCVCVCRAVIAERDVAAAARRLRAQLDRASPWREGDHAPGT